MKSKTSQYLIIAVVAIFLLGGAFSGGVLVGWLIPVQAKGLSLGAANGSLPTLASPAGTAPSTASPQDTQTLFKPFWDTWDLIHQEYVNQPVNDTTLMRGAIKGMMDSLGDIHTSYMDPTIYQEVSADLNGKTYDGIGAWVDTTGQFLKIVSPMPNSPAQKAGLKSGDLIIAVDKEDMTGKPGEVVLKRVLGTAGTSVTLTIVRAGTKEPFDVNITRAKITVPQVDGKMLDNKIAYVKLFTFGDTTDAELRSYLKDLLAQKPVGLILDLRDNGGGYLDTAIQIVSEYIPSGSVVMFEKFGDGTSNTYKAKSGGLATDIPLVVLVNEGTASASEITAGAIQDLGRGKLVGVKTYGKGSVQHINELKDDGGAVRITIAHWLTPKERLIDKLGLTPDVVVQRTDDDIKNDRDPQLDKAVELLLSSTK